MKKYFTVYGICWAIALVVFNVITFVSAANTIGISNAGAGFWVGYIFITIVFIGNLVCSFLFFKEENIDKIFLKLPIIYIAYIALIVSLIAGAIAMAIPVIPYWVGIVVDVVILAVYAIAIVQANTAADVVSEIDDRVKAQTFFIKSLTTDAQILMSFAQSDDVQTECKKVYESIRYSDPMSNDALAEIERQIQNEFKTFDDAVKKDNTELVKNSANKMIALINKRNSQCKVLKQKS